MWWSWLGRFWFEWFLLIKRIKIRTLFLKHSSAILNRLFSEERYFLIIIVKESYKRIRNDCKASRDFDFDSWNLFDPLEICVDGQHSSIALVSKVRQTFVRLLDRIYIVWMWTKTLREYRLCDFVEGVFNGKITLNLFSCTCLWRYSDTVDDLRECSSWRYD